MRSSKAGLYLLCAVAMSQCSEPAGVPGPQFSGHDNGVVMSANGGGKINVTAPPPAIGIAEFSFGANQNSDGRVNGRFHMKRQRAGFNVEFRGSVICMSVDPLTNRAWIGGIVEENLSDDPNHTTAIHQPGEDVWFRVVDNGEGKNSPPDRSTVYGFKGAAGVATSEEYCALKLWPAGDVNTFEVTQGNIQVRSRD